MRATAFAVFLSALTLATTGHASEPLNPAKGSEIGTVVEGFLTPQQEPGEEKDAPSVIPDALKSKGPMRLRAERTGRGHAQVRFTKDLSRAYVDVKLENIPARDVVMFHIHCGRPDMLGPIIVDFGHFDDLTTKLAGGTYSFEVTNTVIERTAAGGHGLLALLTAGCPVDPANVVLFGKVKTVAGMEYIARKGELYLNLHTRGQMFYGDIRGQLIPVAGERTP
jgi:hypothetical protein